jgi:hypothetical protein
MKYLKVILLIFFVACEVCYSQDTPGEKTELRLKLNENGSRYIKATFLNQIWVRYNQSNPGTMVLNESSKETLDIGLRRTRFQLFGQVTNRTFIYIQFGQNNFNYLSANSGNRKLQAFFHDALGEYRIFENESLTLGGGLTITNGLSRFSQPSVSTIMSMDVPVFAQATVDQTDEFSRKLSLYARGQLGKLDYRLILSDPFPITTNGQLPPAISSNATFSQVGHSKQYQALLIWNLRDKETHVTPYMTGTYLGSKNVFNIEAGFISHPQATWTRESLGADTVYHTMNLWSVAIFYDGPVNKEKGTALSAYAGYFNYNFGPGYLRYNGIMNPATSINGSFLPGSQGNSIPMMGTGDIWYGQLGYLLPRHLLGEGKGTLMPYATLMCASYERLHKQMTVFDFGINWLMQGHTSKITLDFQNRPTYEIFGTDLVRKARRNQVVLQYQIYF